MCDRCSHRLKFKDVALALWLIVRLQGIGCLSYVECCGELVNVKYLNTKRETNIECFHSDPDTRTYLSGIIHEAIGKCTFMSLSIVLAVNLLLILK